MYELHESTKVRIEIYQLVISSKNIVKLANQLKENFQNLSVCIVKFVYLLSENIAKFDNQPCKDIAEFYQNKRLNEPDQNMFFEQHTRVLFQNIVSLILNSCMFAPESILYIC